jgi:hypothetical protein
MYRLKQTIQKKTKPNQGIQLSAFNGFLVAFCTSLLFIGLIRWIFNRNVWFLFLPLPVYFFTLFGGNAYIQHYALRSVLFFYGYTPFFYVEFLNDMANQRILQRVGGSYRFLHNLLLEHMADKKWMKLE